MRSAPSPPLIVSTTPEPVMMSSPSSPLIVAPARFGPRTFGAESAIVSLPPPALTTTVIVPSEFSVCGPAATGSRSVLPLRASLPAESVSAMFSAVLSPVMVRVVPLIDGTTAAFAAAGTPSTKAAAASGRISLGCMTRKTSGSGPLFRLRGGGGDERGVAPELREALPAALAQLGQDGADVESAGDRCPHRGDV